MKFFPIITDRGKKTIKFTGQKNEKNQKPILICVRHTDQWEMAHVVALNHIGSQYYPEQWHSRWLRINVNVQSYQFLHQLYDGIADQWYPKQKIRGISKPLNEWNMLCTEEGAFSLLNMSKGIIRLKCRIQNVLEEKAGPLSPQLTLCICVEVACNIL